MAETKSTDTKKSTNPLVFIGIGCLVLLVVIGVIASFAMKFFAEKIGKGIVQNVIESKTGVKTNIQDLEKGKMTFTDSKTGTSINIGSDKIPDTFPKDFPIYAGMKLLSSMSGTEKQKNTGFWLTFSSPDSFEKVSAFYKTALPKNGWTEDAAYTAGKTSTATINKGKYSGSLSITQEENAKETNVIIMLGDDASSKVTEETPVE